MRHLEEVYAAFNYSALKWAPCPVLKHTNGLDEAIKKNTFTKNESTWVALLGDIMLYELSSNIAYSIDHVLKSKRLFQEDLNLVLIGSDSEFALVQSWNVALAVHAERALSIYERLITAPKEDALMMVQNMGEPEIPYNEKGCGMSVIRRTADFLHISVIDTADAQIKVIQQEIGVRLA